MRYVNADQPTLLGYAGEINETTVSIKIPVDWSGVTANNLIAAFTAPNTNTAIPYTVTVSNGYALWVVDEYAASAAGAGTLQLIFLLENSSISDFRNDNTISVRAKSEVYDTICKHSTGEETPVTPSTPWIDKIVSLVNYFTNMPTKVANKNLGTDENNNWVLKDSEEYTAGNGIEIDEDNEVSIDEDIVATNEKVEDDIETHDTSNTSHSDIRTSVTTLESKVPDEASSSNKLADKSYTTTAISTHNSAADAHSDIRTSINTINGEIMSGTTSSNPLTNQSFVNSSIATETANHKGTFDCVTDLGLSDDPTNAEIAAKLPDVVSSATNNDYSYVIVHETPTEQNSKNTVYKRFKYTSSTSSWGFEYKLNTTGFTAQQWSAINSGADSSKITGYDSHVASTANPHSTSFTNLQGNASDNTSLSTALNNKVDKTTTGMRVYATNSSGQQMTMAYESAAVADTIVARGGTGNFNITTPTKDAQAANKGYVDSAVSAVSAKFKSLNSKYSSEKLIFTFEDGTTQSITVATE